MDKNKVQGLDLLEVSVFPTLVHGKPALELRKIITFCDKNSDILNEILYTGFSNKPIYLNLPISIRFRDKLIAKQRLLEMGIQIEQV